MKFTQYKDEMREFQYDAMLHIHHPRVEPEAITTALGIQPTRSHRRGDARKTPRGDLLSGTYSATHWTCALPTEDQQDLTAFLERTVELFRDRRTFLAQLAQSGGTVVIFLGVFSNYCCAHQFDNELLRELAESGFDLRLDFYGSYPPRPNDSLED